MGTRLCRLGRAKLFTPLPPYVVPSSANNAVFCWIDSSCPLHSAQFLGAKPKLIILTSPKKGLVTGTLPRKPPNNRHFPTQTQVLDGFKYNRRSKAPGRPQGLAFRPVLPYNLR